MPNRQRKGREECGERSTLVPSEDGVDVDVGGTWEPFLHVEKKIDNDTQI